MAKLVKDDITYNEVDARKIEIEKFIEYIKGMDFKHFSIEKYDEVFFIYISKHIMFFKYMSFGTFNERYYKVLISDCYYFILAILKVEKRYMYLNERSIIENYIRLIVDISVENDHVTENSFIKLKSRKEKYNVTDDEYSLIRSEYVEACGYVHGASSIDETLSYVFDECINNKFALKDRAKYYDRIKALLKSFDRMLIIEYAEIISGCFHRKKAVLEYLLGKKEVDLLFDVLNGK